ncbi:choice-of-anchor D domain-containing protein [candidate division KSB1 bacterium]|nr:choice-of-anchor D domain-containing protein [candidate division KSB1 bacterium]NIR72709.1 choice-of-anchor D domain-containing protein [candidate division KSB1 bacterium]NIS26794.1 choice-of-anchor D domain-containing protein [candidate division KSB1 bacterium]NIT73588.1 choice-of-anchor D domain-containing protein [candidate division KSB1 bacterium]NIU27464.1 choice-of-anchor D domain-containing protein [candidate division KSB1 bacterium]
MKTAFWFLGLERSISRVWSAAILSALICWQTALSQTSEPIEVGYRDFSYPKDTGANSEVTAEKPESKLWWNDGHWWASMWSTSGNSYRIHRLDLETQSWIDTGTDLDPRSDTKADVLWDGEHLYVVSHIWTTGGDSAPPGERGELFRYSYNSVTDTYSLDSGFPVEISSGISETLVLTKDTIGQLWVTYVENSKVMLNHNINGDDRNWDTPYVLPAGEFADVSSDDISSIIAFDGKVIVLWSKQSSPKAMYVATHEDGASDQEWSSGAAYSISADDHISMSTLACDKVGRLFAVIKTSRQVDVIVLLVCESGKDCTVESNWKDYPVYRTSDFSATRPIVVLDSENKEVYVFSRNRETSGNGDIFYKVTDVNNIDFPTGIGSPFIQSADDNKINDPTASKQTVNAETGLVVLASDRSSKHYFHNYIDLPSTQPTPDIAVAPTAHDYGDVVVGNSQSQTFEIANQGDADLDVSATSLTGSDAAEFSIDAGGGAFTLAPNQTHNVDVSFNPTSTGTKNAALEFSSNDPDENPLQVNLTGNATEQPQPDIAATPTSHDYGNVFISSSATQTFEIANNGSADLNVSATSLTGADAAEFSIDNGSGSFTLAPNQTHNIDVSFNPTSTGTKNAALEIQSNDPDENPSQIPLTGTGEDPPPSSGQITFKETQSGGTSDINSVTTNNPLAAEPGNLYLASIATKPYTQANSVSGLGLQWTLLRTQCAGRKQTGVEVWMAQGNPNPGTVTATLNDAPRNSVITVARYAGADFANPIGNIVSGNTNGENGTCSGGSDSNAYNFNISTSVNHANVFAAIAMRNKKHTPGTTYSERSEFLQGSGGAAASAANMDRPVSTPTTVSVNGTFDDDVDWAMIALEIKPQTTLAKESTDSDRGVAEGPFAFIPQRYELNQNYPNPFNPSTTVTFAVPKSGEVKVTIYNLRGQLIRTLISREVVAGQHKVIWDGKDNNNLKAASGVYVYRLQANDFVATKRLVLTK